jgi:hypothetical protein
MQYRSFRPSKGIPVCRGAPARIRCVVYVGHEADGLGSARIEMAGGVYALLHGVGGEGTHLSYYVARIARRITLDHLLYVSFYQSTCVAMVRKSMSVRVEIDASTNQPYHPLS